MSPTVSVITIFLDAGAFLREAIDSVYAQTFQDWELLLVDDGSSDGSTAIARRAAADDPGRVRYLEHPGHANRGMSASRNLGAAASRAPFLAFLDADDVFLPEKLAYQTSLLGAHPDVGMVYGPMSFWWGWTGDASDTDRDRLSAPRVPLNRPIDPPELFRSYIRRLAPTPATCSVLLRRDVFENVGGFEESFRGMYEDQVFFYKVALHERVLVTDRPMDRYRQHDGSTSARALVTGEWSRRGPNVSYDRFTHWLREYGRADTTHALVVRREVRRARLRRRWSLSLAGRAVRHARGRWGQWRGR